MKNLRKIKTQSGMAHDFKNVKNNVVLTISIVVVFSCLSVPMENKKSFTKKFFNFTLNNPNIIPNALKSMIVSDDNKHT